MFAIYPDFVLVQSRSADAGFLETAGPGRADGLKALSGHGPCGQHRHLGFPRSERFAATSPCLPDICQAAGSEETPCSIGEQGCRCGRMTKTRDETNHAKELSYFATSLVLTMLSQAYCC